MFSLPLTKTSNRAGGGVLRWIRKRLSGRQRIENVCNEKGYKLIHIWVDADSFLVKSRKDKDVQKPELTLRQLYDELIRATDGIDEDFAARLFSELAVYAREARELWDLEHLTLDLFKIKESKVTNWRNEPKNNGKPI